MVPYQPPSPRHPPRRAVLSPRETQVLEGLIRGETNYQIGHRLLLSEGTVKTYMKSLLRDLGAVSRTHAVALVLTGAVVVTVDDEGRRVR